MKKAKGKNIILIPGPGFLFLLILAALSLSACGGGGGGGGGSSSSSSSGSSSSSSSSSGGYGKQDLVNDFATLLFQGYENLNTQFNGLASASSGFCADTSSESNFEALKLSWESAMQAWQYVQGINFGPIDEDTRRYRIAFYPLDQNQLASRVNDLISSDGEITQSIIAGRSVDLQGLPALEYIYFREDALMLINVPSETARYCALANAIADNLSAMSLAVASAWGDTGAYRSTFTSAANQENSLEDWFGSLVEHIQIIEDTKLRSPAVGNIGDIESPYARHSRVNIQQNISLIENAFTINADAGIQAILLAGDASAVAVEFENRLSALITPLHSTTSSISELSDSSEGVEEIEALADAVHQLLEHLAVEVAEALDVFIGFNGTDGD